MQPVQQGHKICFMSGSVGEGVASLWEDLHQVLGPGASLIEGDGVRYAVTGINDKSSDEPRGVVRHYCLDCHLHGCDIQRVAYAKSPTNASGKPVKDIVKKDDKVKHRLSQARQRRW